MVGLSSSPEQIVYGLLKVPCKKFPQIPRILGRLRCPQLLNNSGKLPCRNTEPLVIRPSAESEGKMSLKSLIVVLTVTLCQTSGKKILCQMVSVETDEGISGYCCVIFRNQTEINLQEDEVKQQILDSFRNATAPDEISPRLAENNNTSSSDALNFPTEDYSGIKFPGATNSEDLKNISSADQKKHPETTRNSTMDRTNGNETIIGFAVNRNSVDVPETCPQGSEKDINGECVPVY